MTGTTRRAQVMGTVFGLGVVAFACVLTASDDTAAKPNVLIILADDLGYSDIGCYGGDIKTPNLDTLAAGGLRFTQFYNTARCWPTRGALMTGYYAQQIRRDLIPGVANMGARGTRPAWAALLPEMLRPAGYRTYHSGKWHIDGEPVENGFDHSYYLSDQDRFFSPRGHSLDGKRLPQPDPDSGFYATTAIADHAVKCLRSHAAEHSDQPFFQFVAFTSPHFPLHALQQDIDKYREVYQCGWEEIRRQRFERMRSMGIVDCALSAVERNVGPPYHNDRWFEILGPDEVNRPLPWGETSDGQQKLQATKMAIHAAMVDRMDQEIGRILEELRSMQVLENTLIIFFSDNGASAEIMVRGDGHDASQPLGSWSTYLCLGPGWSTSSNTPFRRHKTWVHEGGISTPLIFHWPARITDAGSLRQQPGHVVDLLPTVLEVAGVTRPSSWRGVPVPDAPGTSLVPAWQPNAPRQDRSLWWFHDGHCAIRMGDWKAVRDQADGVWELYDLSTDRAESHDASAQHPDKARELAEAWERQLDECRRLATGND